MEYPLPFLAGYLRLCTLALLSAFIGSAHAATRTSNGTGGGNWNAGASWAGGIAPAAGDNAIIAAGDQINLTTNQTCVNLTVNGTLNLSNNNRTLTVTGNLTFAGTGSVTGNGATRTINVTGNLAVNAGATSSLSGFTFSVTGTSAITGSLTFASNTGSRTFTGDVTVGGSLLFGANVTIALGGQLITTAGSTVGGGGGTGTINAAGRLFVSAGGTSTFTTLALTCGGNSNVVGTAAFNGGAFTFFKLQISGTGVLDASGGANTIYVAGDWSNTSTAADPFVEGTSVVYWNGSSGTQQISRSGGTETFYDLRITNTSAAMPGVLLIDPVAVTDDLDHTSGTLDLGGKALTLTGSGTAQTHSLTGAAMITSVAGGSFTVTDPSNINRINFTTYRLGDATQDLTVDVTCGRIQLVGVAQYGPATFTKTLNVDDVFGGGNYYHGPVTFTATASASRWRMGDNVAVPDTFVNATFNANALAGTNNNFIICSNSHGNAFYGTTRMTSTTVGGFFICRQNGNGTADATFHGPVVARVTHTGNITFADSDSSHANTVTFDNTVQAQSSNTSTGDIYFGNSGYSAVNLTTNGQFITGTVQGLTSVYFRRVTQVGNLQQSLIGISNSRVYCGGTAYPVVFNGPVDLKADTVQVNSTTFQANADLWGLSHLTVAYSTFNGSTNTFTKQGSGNSNSIGGNTFAAGSNNTFVSTGPGHMRLAVSQPDDVNGNVLYKQTGAGALVPAYGTACTYSGDISTVNTQTAIQFGTGGGTVVLDGTAQSLDGDAAYPPLFYRLTTAMATGLTLNVNATVRTLLTLNSGTIDANNNTLTLGISTAVPGTLARTGGWVSGGAFNRWFPVTAVAVGSDAGLFPMGTPTAEYRPLWFGSSANLSAGGTLSVRHSPTASGHISAFHADASWGNTVVGVSTATWSLTAANGFAVNGSTGALRFGGEGFSPFVLTDLNASLASSVLGTYAATTSASVPLEANRTALNTVGVAQAWHIGTRNGAQSPLPIELLGFSAEPVSRYVDLAWTTLTETNSDHFTVERSADGVDFHAVLTLPAAGNSIEELHYAARDPQPLNGWSYYRLKEVDLDGTPTLSEVVPVHLALAGDPVIQPVPFAQGALAIQLPDAPSAPVDVRVVGLDARIVLEQAQHTDEAGWLRIEREAFGAAAPGVYHVLIHAAGRDRTGALVLE